MLTLEQIEEIERSVRQACDGTATWTQAEVLLMHHAGALLRTARRAAEASADAEEIAERIYEDVPLSVRVCWSSISCEEWKRKLVDLIAAALARQREEDDALMQWMDEQGEQFYELQHVAETDRDRAYCIGAGFAFRECVPRLRARIGEGNKQ